MIRAIVFDIDGVLIEPMVFRSVLDQQYGISPETTADFFAGPFKQCSTGKADMKEHLPEYLDQWQWPGSLDDFMRKWFEADSSIDSQMMELVNNLRDKGIPLYIASTQEKHRARYLESEMGFEDLFDELFFSCRLGCEKPEQEFYDLVSSTIAVDPGEILFFDDLQPNVAGARTAGWNAELHVFATDLTDKLSRYGIDVENSE